MTRTLIAALATAAALSAPAFANSIDTSGFTASQLVQLKAAQDDDNHTRIRQILADVNAGGTGGAPSFEQVANSIDAEGLTGSDVVSLKAAIDEDDNDRIFGLRGGSDATATFSTRSVSAEQLSASVGVEAGSLTASELVQLKAAEAEDDHEAIRRIRNAAK